MLISSRLICEILDKGYKVSFLIILVLILRLIFVKMPKRVKLILWGIVALQLLLPMKISSPFSFYSILDSGNTLQIARGGKVELIESGSQQIDSGVIPYAAFSPVSVLISIWLAGIVVIITYSLINLFRLYLLVREAIPYQDNIWLCDNVKSPFVMGLFSSKIYISSSMDQTNLKYVIAHEQAHILRRDQWWKCIGYILLAVYWMNPLSWLVFFIFCRDLEYACDEKVISSYTLDEKKAYCYALLECSMQKKLVIASPLCFGEISVKGRVDSILNYRKPSIKIVGISIIGCVAIAMGFLTNPIKLPLGKMADGIYSDGRINDRITVDNTVVWIDNYSYDGMTCFLDYRIEKNAKQEMPAVVDCIVDDALVVDYDSLENDSYYLKRKMIFYAYYDPSREICIEVKSNDSSGEGRDYQLMLTEENSTYASNVDCYIGTLAYKDDLHIRHIDVSERSLSLMLDKPKIIDKDYSYKWDIIFRLKDDTELTAVSMQEPLVFINDDYLYLRYTTAQLKPEDISQIIIRTEVDEEEL